MNASRQTIVIKQTKLFFIQYGYHWAWGCGLMFVGLFVGGGEGNLQVFELSQFSWAIPFHDSARRRTICFRLCVLSPRAFGFPIDWSAFWFRQFWLCSKWERRSREMKTTTNYIDDDQKHKTQLVQDTHTTTCKTIKYWTKEATRS